MTIFGAPRAILRAPGGPAPCVAPEINLHFLPNGEVRTCSRSTLSLGRWPEQSVRELWDGHWRGEVRSRLSTGDFSAGCQGCGLEFEVEGRAGSIAAAFDVAPGGATALEGAPGWPLRFDFMLSNVCNLQCVQCHGGFSSSIRRHREDLPPLASPYDDRFVDQIEEFLPGLHGAQFAGGEPFLVPINFALWERIAAVAPELDCAIITNGTRLTAKVKRTLESIRAHLIVSIDSLDPDRAALLRVGSDISAVVEHLEWFGRYASDRGTSIGINFCLMRDNLDDLLPVARFAEERGFLLNLVPVREPAELAIRTQPPAEQRAAADALARLRDDEAAGLPMNGAALVVAADRVNMWATRAEAGVSDGTVLMLRPRHAARAARLATRLRRQVEREMPLAQLVRMTLHGDLLGGSDSSLGPLPAETLREVLALVDPEVSRFGAILSQEVRSFDDDHLMVGVVMEHTDVLLALVAHRERRSRDLRVEVLLASQERDGAADPAHQSG